jgi:hypothetical protein
MRLIVQGGRLRIVGGPALVPVTKDRFHRWDGEVMSRDELQFLSDDEFGLESMEGKTTRHRRARPWRACSGCDEIGSVFQVGAGEGGLVVRLEHSPARSLEFRSVDRATFQLGVMTVRFQREQTGKVVAFGYSNALARGVTVTRLSDGTSRR